MFFTKVLSEIKSLLISNPTSKIGKNCLIVLFFIKEIKILFLISVTLFMPYKEI